MREFKIKLLALKGIQRVHFGKRSPSSIACGYSQIGMIIGIESKEAINRVMNESEKNGFILDWILNFDPLKTNLSLLFSKEDHARL